MKIACKFRSIALITILARRLYSVSAVGQGGIGIWILRVRPVPEAGADTYNCGNGMMCECFYLSLQCNG